VSMRCNAAQNEGNLASLSVRWDGEEGKSGKEPRKERGLTLLSTQWTERRAHAGWNQADQKFVLADKFLIGYTEKLVGRKSRWRALQNFRTAQQYDFSGVDRRNSRRSATALHFSEMLAAGAQDFSGGGHRDFHGRSCRAKLFGRGASRFLTAGRHGYTTGALVFPSTGSEAGSESDEQFLFLLVW